MFNDIFIIVIYKSILTPNLACNGLWSETIKLASLSSLPNKVSSNLITPNFPVKSFV